MLFSLPAFVLDKIKVKEIDYLIELLTPRGKIKALAKGAQKSRRRFVNLLDDLTFIRAHLRKPQRGRTLILEGADALYIPESPRYVLKKFYFFSYVAEVLSYTSFGPLNREQFGFLVEFIKEIDRNPWEDIYKCLFETRWSVISGFAPLLDECVKCQERPRRLFYFSISAGGILCVNCKDDQSIRLSSFQIDLLKKMAKIEFPEEMSELKESFSREEGLQIKSLVEAFFLYHIDWEPRSLPFLKSEVGSPDNG
ncbi:MAG: DNA repair protein RecO [Caldimicrobium sp.]|nr:DNA repair protein RecO [Caldimicrobium sp.]MCX7613802.1 DNA repair protein RecO [Caldimicrobium sp.]MDW8182629.1 DNA repair protein RecO [Caldimicrobium sp.]